MDIKFSDMSNIFSLLGSLNADLDNLKLSVRNKTDKEITDIISKQIDKLFNLYNNLDLKTLNNKNYNNSGVNGANSGNNNVSTIDDVKIIQEIKKFIDSKKFIKTEDLQNIKETLSKLELHNYSKNEVDNLLDKKVDEEVFNINLNNINEKFNNLDLSNYALKSELPSVDLKADKSELDLKADLDYINNIKNEINNNLDLKANKTDLDTKVDLDYINNIKNEINNNLDTKADKSELTNYALKTDLPSVDGLVNKSELTNYALKSDLPSVDLKADKSDLDLKADKTEINEVKTTLDTKIDTKADKTELTNYALKTELPSVGGLVNKSDLDLKADKSDLDLKADKTEINEVKTTLDTKIDTKADKTEINEVKTTLDTKIDTKADKTELTNYALKSELPSVDGLVNKSDLDLKADKSELTNYALKSELPSVDGLVNKSDLDLKADKSELTNYALKSEIDNLLIKKEITSIKVFEQGNHYNTTLKDSVTDNPYYRIPAMEIANNGNLVVISDFRKTPKDQVKIGVIAAISKDNGKTWDYKTVVEPFGTDANARVMDSTILKSNKTGRLIVINGRWDSGTANWIQDINYRNIIMMSYSDDNGETWTPKELKLNAKPADVTSILGGVGRGIELYDGSLVCPIQYTKGDKKVYAGYMVSVDNGTNWWWSHLNEGVEGVSENNIFQTPNGYIYMSGRNDKGINQVYQLMRNKLPGSQEILNGVPAIHPDEAIGNSSYEFRYDLVESLSGIVYNGVQATQTSAISFKTPNGVPVFLISGPENRDENGANQSWARPNIKVWYSEENTKCLKELINAQPKPGMKWTDGVPYGGYSCLAYNEGRLFIAYEDDLGISIKDLSSLIPTLEKLKPSDSKYSKDGLLAEVNMADVNGETLNSKNSFVDAEGFQLNIKKGMIGFNNYGSGNPGSSSIQFRGFKPKMFSEGMTIQFKCFIEKTAKTTWNILFAAGQYRDFIKHNQWKNTQLVSPTVAFALGYENPASLENMNWNPNVSNKKDYQSKNGTELNNIKPGFAFVIARYNAKTNTADFWINGEKGTFVNDNSGANSQVIETIIIGNDLVKSKQPTFYLDNIKVYNRPLRDDEVETHLAIAKNEGLY